MVKTLLELLRFLLFGTMVGFTIYFFLSVLFTIWLQSFFDLPMWAGGVLVWAFIYIGGYLGDDYCRNPDED